MSEAYAYSQDDDGFEEGVDESAPAKPAQSQFILQAPKSANLAFDLDDTILGRIGAKVVEEFKIDCESRAAAGYDERIKRAVELATLAATVKNTPWEGASNVKYPLIIQAAIQFNARSYAAVIDGPEVVKGAAKGAPDPEKTARAERVGKHMSWQLLEEEEEWEEDTDALLLRLSIVGTLMRKRYFDPTLGRTCSHVIGPDEFVVNYKAKRDLSVVPRMTHVLTFYPHEILEKRRSGLWLDVELGQATDAANDEQAPHEFLEQHRLWDLDEDGYPEPYIVTVHRETEKVVRIVARWYEEGVKTNDRGEIVSIKPYECFTKYGFIPSPDGGFYDIGYGTLLGSTADTINTVQNQLMDAATLANLQGGFIGDGVSIKSGNMRFRPGEWKRVATNGGMLKDAIVPMPVKEPSAVLYNLMVFLIETAKDLTATQEILTGDAGKGTMPVGTVQALVEQGLKTFTAIVKRIHRALKRELRILYQLNARYLEPQVYFTFQDQPMQVIREDYLEGDLNVVPVSDPNMATDLQRMGQAQFVMELASGGAPIDPRKATMLALAAAKVQDPEGLMIPEGPPPEDPKITIEKEKLALDRERLDMEKGKAAAEVESKNAQTEQTRLETFLAGPEMADLLSQAVQAGIQQALALVNDGGQPEVRPTDLLGMEGPSADEAPVPVPGGPEAGVDGELGPGGFDEPGGPIPGEIPAGIDDPGMAGTG